jgi:hypothetical protein
MRLSWARWIAAGLAAWLFAAGAYLALLALADTFLGARQIGSELLFGSQRALAFGVVRIVLESAWIALPVACAAAAITLAGPGPATAAAAAGRALLCSLAVAAVLVALGFTALQASTFAVALFAAALVAFVLAKIGRHAPA